MPGIYGYIKNNSQPASQPASQLNAMTNLLNHHPHFIKEDDFIDEHFAASHLHLGNMKAYEGVFYRQGIYISIEGEQYDYPQDVFEELLFDAYSNDRLDAFLNTLDGYFNAVIYDANTQKVKLISDRYGMRMLYFYHKDGNFAFSSEVKGLLGLDFVDAAIDAKQLDVFMDLGYLLEDNTWHKHIKLIKSASILEFDIQSKSLTQRYYWKWSEIKASGLSFDEAVDKLGQLWLEAVKKRFTPNKKIGISLSGGLDSRAIFAALHRLYPNYQGYAYTFGTPNCDDITIAKRCIAQTKWQHEVFHLTSNNWFEPRKERVWFTDGMLSFMHMHGSEFLSAIKENININLNGYAGDAIAGGGFLKHIPFDVKPTPDGLRFFYQRYADELMLDHDFYNLNKVEPHLYMNRVRRFTNMGTVNSLVSVDNRKPFFDNKIVELLFSLPDEYRQGNKLYSAMLLEFFPEFFENIPWQSTGITLTKNKLKNFVERTGRFLKRLSCKLGVLESKKSYTDYANWIKESEVSKQLSSLLAYKGSLYSAFTSVDFNQLYLQPHLHGEQDNSEKILRVATFETYLKRINRIKNNT